MKCSGCLDLIVGRTQSSLVQTLVTLEVGRWLASPALHVSLLASTETYRNIQGLCFCRLVVKRSVIHYFRVANG